MRIIILIVLLLSFSGIYSQTSLSLEQAIQMALENNHDAQISALEVEKARSKVKETFATGLPQINAEASFQNFLDIPTTVLPDFISPTVYSVLVDENLVAEGSGGQPGSIPAQFGTEYNVSAGATLSQLIFSGSYLIGLQAAKSYVEFSIIQQERKDIDIKSAVSQAYFTSLLAQSNTSLLRESEGTLSRTLTETEAMYTEGFVEEQDVEQLQLTVNNLKSQIQDAERKEKLSMMLLNFQIGSPLESILTLTDTEEILVADPAVDQLIALAEPDLSSHPDIKLSNSSLLLNELKVKEMKSRYLPTLSGFIQHQQQAQRNDFDFFESGGEWFPSTVWGINLNVPIFTSGKSHHMVKQLQIDVKESELMKDQAEEGLKLNAFQAKSNYLFAKESYELEKENLALAERIKNKTRVKYVEGISSSFELSQMETQFLESQGKMIGASLNLLNATTELKKAYSSL